MPIYLNSLKQPSFRYGIQLPVSILTLAEAQGMQRRQELRRMGTTHHTGFVDRYGACGPFLMGCIHPTLLSLTCHAGVG